MAWPLALCVGYGLAGTGTSKSAAEQENQTEFTPEERAQLAGGELVTRPLRVAPRPGLDLIGGSSWQRIDASPDVLWQALNDTDRYPKLLPRVIEARVVSVRGDQRSVFMSQGKWPIFVSYYLLLRSDEGTRRISFEMDQNKPHGGNAAWGFVQVGDDGSGRALLAFGIAADVGRGIIAAIARGTIEKWMLRVPWTVKKFLESGGKDLYRPQRPGLADRP